VMRLASEFYLTQTSMSKAGISGRVLIHGFRVRTIDEVSTGSGSDRVSTCAMFEMPTITRSLPLPVLTSSCAWRTTCAANRRELNSESRSFGSVLVRSISVQSQLQSSRKENRHRSSRSPARR